MIAPAANSSGTGDNRTPTTGGVCAGTTASGFVGKAVGGFPGDTTTFGLLQELRAPPPNMVISGIHQGQNLSAEGIPVSGTIGAASCAARLHLPAVAVNAGCGPSCGPSSYTEAA